MVALINLFDQHVKPKPTILSKYVTGNADSWLAWCYKWVTSGVDQQ